MHGLEGGESGTTGLPYPYHHVATSWLALAAGS